MEPATTFEALTAAVDFGAAQTAMIGVAAVTAGVLVLSRGIKFVTNQIKN